MKPIAVTGIGMVSALGWSPADTWAAIQAERSGLGRLALFESPRCGHVPVGQVQGDPSSKSLLRSGSRTDHFAVYAAGQAFADAGLGELSGPVRRRIGVVLGTSTGGMIDGEAFLDKLIRTSSFDMSLLRHHLCSCPANAIARRLGLSGFRGTVSDACASGASAVTTACDVIDSGSADIVLAGGADSLTRLTLNGFSSLLNVSTRGCAPFDADRDGMSLGEGAGILVLEPLESAAARGARVRAVVLGFANTCDAFHATAPRPDGSGALAAMTGALDAAGVSPADVGYVNAHGTGTKENDAAEARAIESLFGAHTPPVSSTKRFFGHTLAAAGAIEAIVCVLALEHQAVPANLGMTRVDPSFSFVPPVHTTAAAMDVAMTNSLGFGGANSCLVIACPSGRRGGKR